MNDDRSFLCEQSAGACPARPIRSDKRTAFAHVIDSEDKIERVNESGEFPVNLFADRQRPVHVALEGMQSESLSIWATNSQHGFISRPTKPANLLTIRFVDSGILFHDAPKDGGIVVDPTRALLTSFEEMRYQQVAPLFASTTATISRRVMEVAWQAFAMSDCAGLPNFQATADTHMPGLLAIRRTLRLYQQHLQINAQAADLMTPLLEELFAYQIISVWPKTREEAIHIVADTPAMSVRRAIDYIEDNIQRRVSISQIADASGLSVRTLQSTFKSCMGCSPVQYLIARRLDGVRLDLLKHDDLSVRHIAQSWGFVHMSDFSQRFRERFGQSPSQFRISGWAL